ncbi:cell division regulator GpsB [Enterococcus sp. HY326]|uniref:cell division regulator GpsB n=1 Tax=Enterococcus sp. HY326 TaxID=2971265 RepID=UPI00223ED813|nr:cell division regulator GpsB [Enterococcus sp. HY326]
MANPNYNPKDILQQEFKTKMRGYDPAEVDEFLDNIIKDYEYFNKQLIGLREENERLNARVGQLAKSNEVASRVSSDNKSTTVTNFDILKRLSNLEKEVFGSKINQEENFSGGYSSPSRSSVNAENYSNADNSSELDKTRLF